MLHHGYLHNYAVAQQLYLERGGTLLEKHKVTEIQPGDIISVVTNQATFQTRKLVLTAGAWTQELTKTLNVELPFEVSLENDAAYKVLYLILVTIIRTRDCGL